MHCLSLSSLIAGNNDPDLSIKIPIKVGVLLYYVNRGVQYIGVSDLATQALT